MTKNVQGEIQYIYIYILENYAIVATSSIDH